MPQDGVNEDIFVIPLRLPDVRAQAYGIEGCESQFFGSFPVEGFQDGFPITDVTA